MDNAVPCFDISFDQTHWVIRPAVNMRLTPARITKHTQAFERYQHPLHIGRMVTGGTCAVNFLLKKTHMQLLMFLPEPSELLLAYVLSSHICCRSRHYLVATTDKGWQTGGGLFTKRLTAEASSLTLASKSTVSHLHVSASYWAPQAA